MKYGYCKNHPKIYAQNSRQLCAECTREKHKQSAESKGFTVKEKSNVFNTTRRRTPELRSVQEPSEFNRGRQGEMPEKKSFNFKTSKIKHRSEKGKEIVKQELLLFQKIFNERPHFCEVTGKRIFEFNVCCFSHVLAKGAYPKFRLYEKNIVFCLPDKHFEWEFKTRKTLELSWIETLESALKTEYYRKI